MEDLRFSKSYKYDDPSRCIICLSKVSQKVSNDRRKNGDDNDKREKGKEETVQKMASKSVVKAPGFLTTFNKIWRILNENKSGSSDEIFSEPLITKERSMAGVFSKAPTFCKLCCQKIVAVENLMKAVKRQVAEIKMLLEESRRRKDGGGATKSTITSSEAQSEDDDNDEEDKMEVKEEDWECEESNVALTEQLEVEQSAILPIDVEPCNSGVMECDGDAKLTLEGTGGDEDKDGGDVEEEDDSNWAWDDDDPDYIKSEEDENANDEYEYDEEYSSEEDEEEPLTVKVEDRLKLGIGEEKDPLEIPTTSACASGSGSANHKNSSEMSICCEVKGCGRNFNSLSTLQRHRKLCHPTPIQQQLNLEKLKKVHAAKSPKSPFKILTCDLEACSRKVGSKESLFIHQKQCHLKLMIELGRIPKDDPSKNKFPCSCGRSFPNQTARYCHQSKSKSVHPEFQFKFREIRAKLENGQICDFCDEPVKLTDIMEHLTNHLEGYTEYLVKCPNFNYCGHMFTHSKKLHEGHLKRERFRKTCKKVATEMKFDLKCETCDFTTEKRISLPAHVANEHERGTLAKNIVCPISGCGKMFAVKQSVYFHLHAHRFKKISTQICKFCGETFKIEEMEEHFKGKHGIKEVFGCKECPVKFAEREDYLDHLWDHRHRGLSCEICGDDKKDKFVRYCDLREHYFGVHKLCPKKFVCEKCPCSFWRDKDLNKHKIENHKEIAGVEGEGKRNRKKEAFKCDLCFDNVSFVRDISLISHKIRVHGAEPFRCEICQMTFHYMPEFSKHRKEHAGAEFKKEWKCEVEGCGKSFKSNRSLKLHKECGHGGVEKPHVCGECGRGYTLAQGLKTHRDAVHLGLRPWVCDECGESFTVSNVLKRHKLIHTGERPFECEICGQRFRHREVLRRHKVAHEKKGAEFKPNGPMKQIRKRKGQ